MRVVLVSMPWQLHQMPSAGLGALSAFLRRETNCPIVCLHEHTELYKALPGLYYGISLSDRIGDLIYAAHLHQDGLSSVRETYARWVQEERLPTFWFKDLPPSADPLEEFDVIHRATEAHLTGAVERVLAARPEIVGLTTTVCQLFSSLALAQRLKRADPRCRIVLGGRGVSDAGDRSLLRSYPFVDHVIAGEGERPFLALLSDIARDRPRPSPAAACTLDSLPIPDYSDFNEIAAEIGVLNWRIPVEGFRLTLSDSASAGPDTVRKSDERLAAEISAQADKYKNVWFRIVDEPAACSTAGLASALERHGRSLGIGHRLNGRVHPYDIFRLWEQGLGAASVDIDGLSTSLLTQMGRDVSVIQNLQLMRTCYELGINSVASLVIGFPGASADHIRETADTIRRVAVAYQPLNPQPFRLYRDAASPPPEGLGLVNIRNADEFSRVLPPDVWQTLELPWLDYDCATDQQDWARVSREIDEWRALHRQLLVLDGIEWFSGARCLYYYDGGTFLKIIDRRYGHRDHTLDATVSAIYLYCTELRTFEALYRRFAASCTRQDVDEIIAELASLDLVFVEGDRILSLAVAFRVELAVDRIRRMHAEERCADGGSD